MSALMLYVSPPSPIPVGAMTGMKPSRTSDRTRSALIAFTLPTSPTSMISVGMSFCFSSLR